MSLPTDDLLSPFHDGELNSAERAIVEQRLAASIEARRDLSEIRQVSSLLKELPRGRLTAEFPQQVLQAVEREMLIPSELSNGSANDSSANSSRSRRWIGVVAVLTSAAGLLLLIRAVDERPRRENSADRQLAESNSSETHPAPLEVALDAPTSGRDAPGGFGGGGLELRTADSPVAEARRSSLKIAGPEASSVVGKNLPSVAAIPSVGVASRDSDSLIVDQSGLRDSKIGDVVRAMQTEGTEVAVVWLTVVDRQEGLAGLQFLLSNNHIAREDAVEKLDEAEKSKASASQLHAVFVESNREQLTATLMQLRDKTFWRSMEVDQPIEMAQLDNVRHGQLSVADKLNEGAPATRTAKKDTAAKELPRELAAKSRVAPPSSPSADKKLADVAPAPKPATDPAPAEAKGALELKSPFAKQLTFAVPFDALVQNQNLNQLNQQTRNRGLSRMDASKRTAGEKIADAAKSVQRPMHVLFVVVDQAQPGKSPTNSTKPAATPPAKTRSAPAKPADKDGAA